MNDFMLGLLAGQLVWILPLLLLVWLAGPEEKRKTHADIRKEKGEEWMVGPNDRPEPRKDTKLSCSCGAVLFVGKDVSFNRHSICWRCGKSWEQTET
jgi:hypothetical protein